MLILLDKFFDDKRDMLDNLTQIFVRDVMEQYLVYLTENNISYTFSILDIDNFKLINDNYGHLVGDDVLRVVSKSLLSIVKGKGVVGRYGGDEFIFVFPHLEKYDDVWHMSFDILKSAQKVVFEDHPEITITYTMGLSRFPLNAKTVDELFELADKALYRGKMKGRNCFIVYLPEKHANIDLKSKRDTINSPIYIHKKIYDFMHGENIDKSIKNTLNYIGAHLMIDHICVEKRNKLEYDYIHPISKKKSGFMPFGFSVIDGMMATHGLFYDNTVLSSKLLETNKLYQKLKEQDIYSEVLVEIKVFGDIYGYLRCDMTSVDTGRIWQQEDLVTIQFAAMVIGLILEGKKGE